MTTIYGYRSGCHNDSQWRQMVRCCLAADYSLLVARRLCPVAPFIVASPAYLAEHGHPVIDVVRSALLARSIEGLRSAVAEGVAVPVDRRHTA
jgi:hypothetical protein